MVLSVTAETGIGFTKLIVIGSVLSVIEKEELSLKGLFLTALNVTAETGTGLEAEMLLGVLYVIGPVLWLICHLILSMVRNVIVETRIGL